MSSHYSSYQEFCQFVRGRRVAVLGIGVSNTPLIRQLCAQGARVSAHDKKTREQLGQLADDLHALGVTLHLGEGYLDCLSADLIFKTPGMRYDLPQLVEAAARGATVTSEMEVFFAVCPCKMIAVTGSDGKSTTTTLIAELLRRAGYRVHLGGNLGRPLLPDIMDIGPDDVAVLELSSFQLHTMTKSPHIAVVTNLSPNHLDVHKSMEEYIEAKCNIFLHQRADDLLVLNLGNAVTAGFVPRAKGRVRTFGMERPEADLYADADRSIWVGDRRVLTRAELLLRGDHNVENMMAAIAAVWDLVSVEEVVAVAGSFSGIAHRLEPVCLADGVSWINDSIASSPTRTMACLQAFDSPLLLIVGGYDKKIPFDGLGEALCQKAKAVVLMGATAPLIEAAVQAAPSYQEGCPRLLRAADMRQAVGLAAAEAQAGDTVVLSPACASFDLYRNFEERGEHFKAMVRERYP